MTVEMGGSHEHRQVVEFAGGLRDFFADLPVATTLPVEMERLHTRGNCWRIVAAGARGRSGSHQPTRRLVESAPSVSTR